MLLSISKSELTEQYEVRHEDKDGNYNFFLLDKTETVEELFDNLD